MLAGAGTCGLCVGAAPPFSLEVEAESATVVKPPLVVRRGRGASGGKILYADPEAWARPGRHVAFETKPIRGGLRMDGLGLAQYEINVPKDGRYSTWFRCWFLNNGDDSFYFRADDGPWRRISEPKYFDWRWIRGPLLDLKAGKHRLQIAGREDNSILDKFAVSSDPNYVPRGERGVLGPIGTFTCPIPSARGRPDATVAFLNHFDRTDSAEAVAAGGDPRVGGMHWKPCEEGRFGGGILISQPKAYALILGDENAPGDALAMDFWFRSEQGKNIFADGKQHYLVSVLFHSRLYLAEGPIRSRRRTGTWPYSLRVILDSKRKRIDLRMRNLLTGRVLAPLSLSTQNASAADWHHLLLSWDKKTGRFWLALDGQGQTRTIRRDWDFRPVLGIFLGSAIYFSDLRPLDGVIDELRIRDVPLSAITQPGQVAVGAALARRGRPNKRRAPQPAVPAVVARSTLRKRVETSCRRFLDFYAGLQRNGGWGRLHHHPTLWDFRGGERHTLRTPGNVDFAKGGFTAHKIMDLYLPAYEVFGDKRYLAVARRSGDVLVRGQAQNGVLQAHYFVFPDRRLEPIRDPDVIEMPADEGPARAVVMLVWLARLSGDNKYLRAAILCADLYVKAQNPNGSWPQAYNLRTKRPQGLGYGVVNDGATREPMYLLLLMYHVTNDRRFLGPIVKAGDWVVRVQNKRGGIPGWADQYDAHDRPCWARSFEPPAISVPATREATSMLIFMYWLTHDEKYLDPLRMLAKWLREHPRKQWGYHTHPETADPVHGRSWKIVPGPPVGALRAGPSTGMKDHPAYQPKRIDRLLRYAINLAKDPPIRPPLEKQKVAWQAMFEAQAPRFDKMMAEQNAMGYWVGQSAWKDRAMQCASTVTYRRYVPAMLTALHMLAAAEGRVSPHAVGVTWEHRLRAWPVPDQFDTPLRQARR